MPDIEITPATYANVSYDNDDIRRVVTTLLEQAGLEVPVRIHVDESTPLSKVKTTSLDPLVLAVESGALEDTRRPRQFGEVEAADSLGRQVFKAADRMNPSFGAPPLGEEIPLPHSVAWDTYVAGRLARSGHRAQRQRRVYNFELRHGFTDAALAAFDTLWSADELTWPEIVAISDEARAALEAA